MPFFGTVTSGGGTVVVPPVSTGLNYWIGDAAGNVSLNLSDNTTVATSSIDLGFPAVRAVTVNRPGGNGTIDTTRYYGARTVTWTGSVMGTVAQRSAFLQSLAGLCDPSTQPYLYAQRPGWDQVRRVHIRADQLSAPLVVEQQVQVTWVGVDGVLESSVASNVSLSSSGVSDVFTVSDADLISDTTLVSDQPDFGLPYVRHYPYSYGTGGAEAGSTIVMSAGNTSAPPVIRIYGQCTAPKVLCATTGVLMSWPTLSLADGAFLEVDCANRTALVGGNADSPVGFDYTVSDWPLVPPGTSQWQTTVATSAAGFSVTMGWRDRWL